MSKCNIGFIGSGGIASSHAYALNAMRYFYDDAPDIVLESVTSRDDGTQTALCQASMVFPDRILLISNTAEISTLSLFWGQITFTSNTW